MDSTLCTTTTTGGCATAEDGAWALIECGTRARLGRGDLIDARQWFEAAYREADRTADVPAMAEAALGLCGLWVHEHRTAAAWGLVQARLEHVLTLLDSESAIALRIRARLAAEADYRTGRHAGILAMLERARSWPDPAVRTEVLSIAHHCLLGPDDGALRRTLADELVGEAARAERRGDLLMGLLWQVVDLVLDADPHAERRLGELDAMLSDENHLAIAYVVRAIEVMLAIRGGHLEKAERLALECLELGTLAGDADATAWYGAQLVTIRWYQGRLAELQPMLGDMVHSPNLSAVDYSYFGALAAAAATAGDRRTASSVLATLRGRGLAGLPRSSSWLVTMYGVVEAAYALENEHAAARAYELLRPYAHLPMSVSLGVSCFGSVHHALGVASLATGDVDRAVTHLREAVHANLALGHWPAVVSSRLRLVEALERRGGPGDDEDARGHREYAGELAASMGMPAHSDVASPSQAPAGRGATCTRLGRRWRIEVAHRHVLVDHSVGMLHLAVLTANPGVEVAALDLVAGVDGLGKASRDARMTQQAVLDRAAVARYRQRLVELRDQIDDLDERGDEDGADRARTERGWLMAELAAGTGLGGRSRAFSDSAERARLAVGKAIRRTIAHIEEADPEIGAHLRAGVHTGSRCWYRPL